MLKIKTGKLTGVALDWVVAKCINSLDQIELEKVSGEVVLYVPDLCCHFEPSICWTQGGPIIEREKISISEVPPSIGSGWQASKAPTSPLGFKTFALGSSPLIAAMRCYVSSKLGDNVEIPKELTQC